MSVKLLMEHHLEFLSLNGGCTGSSESTFVKIPHYWKSHVAAELYRLRSTIKGLRRKILILLHQPRLLSSFGSINRCYDRQRHRHRNFILSRILHNM